MAALGELGGGGDQSAAAFSGTNRGVREKPGNFGQVCAMKRNSASDYYDRHALDLADSYEGIPAEAAHPELLKVLKERSSDDPPSALDVGVGTGQDSAWLASLGHQVTAVEPLNAMLQIARQAHEEKTIRWVSDALPDLNFIRCENKTFDVIVLSAVWMHLAQEERENAVLIIRSLLKPSGVAYITLRPEPTDSTRSIQKSRWTSFRNLQVGMVSGSNTLRSVPISRGMKKSIGGVCCLWFNLEVHRLLLHRSAL